MNLVPWKRKRYDNDDFWAPYFPSPRDLFREFFDREPFFGQGATFSPALDVAENDNAYIVTAELPGIDPKDIDISLEGNVLTLRGEKKEESEKKDKNYHRVERRYGSFVRSLTLPAEVNADKIEADYRNGLLEVTLPKSETVKPKKITVKAGK